MKKLKFLVVFVFNINFLSFGQVIEKSQKIKIIEWDYMTKTYLNDFIYQGLKVNDIVRVKLVNLPVNYRLTSTATFLNNHLEDKNDFGNIIKFDKNSEYTNQVKDNETEKKTNAILEKQKNQTEKNTTESIKVFILNPDNDTKLPKSQQKILIKKDPKINDSTLINDLVIGDAENFININKNKNNTKAIIDITWQKYLIQIAQKNWHNQLIFRDSLLNNYAKEIDKLKGNLVAQNSKIDSLSNRKKYSTTPIKIENYDYTTFNFTISDKDGSNEANLNIPFKNYNGFKIDFSTGILVNGLFSPSYKIITNPSDSTKKQIVEESDTSSKFNTGICLMAHAYSRWGEYINVGIGSGFSYNLNQQNLNFLLGGSFLFGAEQRFISTVGVNVGKVKQLSSYYEINKDYNTTEFTNNTTVPTIEVLKASWFISITYNLGIGNPSKTKKI